MTAKKLGLKQRYAHMTRGLDWETTYQPMDKVFPYDTFEGIKIKDWSAWEDPFRLTMDAYWKFQAENERKLYAPKVEAEIAFVIGRDLEDEHLTIADILRAVEFALPAIEIVDSRIADWKIGILDTIADNASSGLYTLGASPKKLDGLELRLCGMVMEEGGDEVSVGAGAACLGDPLSATLWLAKTMARVGRPLKAGDTVMSGALGPMVTVKRGEVYEARISGLGSVRAAFAKE